MLTKSSFAFWGPVYTLKDGTLSSPGFTGNTYADNPWDRVLIPAIGENGLPGIAEVMCNRVRAFDKKKPAGSDGATVTIHGLDLADVEIRLLIWTPEQLRVLNEIWPVLLAPVYKTVTKTVFANNNPTRTTATASADQVHTLTIPSAGKTKAVTKTSKVSDAATFDVYHPKLALHGVTKIQILSGSGPDPGPVSRSRIFTIKAIQYHKAEKNNATVTPQASAGSTYDPNVTIKTPGSNPANTGP